MRQILTIILFVAFLADASGQSSLIVLLTKTDAFCNAGSASVNVQGGTPPYLINWSTGATSTSIDNLSFGEYSVKVQDANSKDTILHFNIDPLICDVGIPNHFTPNEDGFNDYWSISNIQYFPNFELTVFNRWGQTVRQEYQIHLPWDGKSFGVTLPDATYYYIFYYDKSDRSKFKKGDVSILR